MFHSSIAHRDDTLKDYIGKLFLALTSQNITSKEWEQISLLTGTGMEMF